MKLNKEKITPPDKETYFQNKVIVITGGASGIGRAFTDRFHQLGAVVTILDIKDLDEQIGINSVAVDVTDESSFSELQNMKPDILVVAAGVTSETDSPTPQEIEAMDAVNVEGVRNTLDAFGSLLTDGSQIVYVGTDNPPKNYYKKTKELGADIVREFAKDNPDVDVRLLLVGPVRTALFERGKPIEVIERIAKNVGLYEPSEFADEVIDTLFERSDGLKEVKMYRQVDEIDG